MIVGDCNTISKSHEKEGEWIKPQRQMDSFNGLMEDLRVEDMGYKGQLYTR